MLLKVLKEFKPKGKLNPNEKIMKYVDIAYCFGIIFVLFGHSHPLDGSWVNTWYWHLNTFIYTFHMPLYFFISGYLIVHSNGIERIGYSKWASNKLLKFSVPYLVLTVLAFVPKSFLGDTADAVDMSFKYLFETTFINPRIGVWGHFWFIPVFLMLEFYWGAWRAKSKNNPSIYRLGLIIGFLVSLAIACYPIKTDMYTLYDLSQEAIFYACGVIVALCKPTVWDKWWKNIIGILGPAALVSCLYKYGNYSFREYPFINFLVGILIIWAVWNLSVLISRIPKLSFPAKITKYTFNIYIYSWPAQAALDAILRRMGVNWVIIVCILFVSGFVAPLLIVFIYKKLQFLHCKFFDYLIGINTNTKKGAKQL